MEMVSLITVIEVVFISLFIAYLYDKVKRGHKLSMSEKIGLSLSIIADFLVISNYLYPTIPPISSFILTLNTFWKIGLAFSLIIIAIILTSRLFIKMNRDQFDRNLLHLKVHYIAPIDVDTPKKEQIKIPKYIENINKFNARSLTQAYWIPSALNKKIKQGKIKPVYHVDEKALNNFFSVNNIHLNETDASFSDLQIGINLQFKKTMDKNIFETFKKLKSEGKLEKYQIIPIFPKHKFLLYMFSHYFAWKDYPPNKCIITVDLGNLQSQPNQAYGAPNYWEELTDEHLIDLYPFYPFLPFWHSVPNICKHKGFHFNTRHLSLEDIVNREKNNIGQSI
jgi:hypothetical protein